VAVINKDYGLPGRDAVQSGRHAVRVYAPSTMGTRLRHQKSDVVVTPSLETSQIIFEHTPGIQDTSAVRFMCPGSYP
jgi:hypothetical protein